MSNFKISNQNTGVATITGENVIMNKQQQDLPEEILNLTGKFLADAMKLTQSVYKFDGTENKNDVLMAVAFENAAKRIYENAIAEKANRVKGQNPLTKLLNTLGFATKTYYHF